MPEEQLKLATLFTGQVDNTFRRAVGQLQSILQGLGKIQSGIQSRVASVTNTATSSQNKFNQALMTTRGQVSQVSGGMERLSRAAKVITSFGIAGAIIYNFVTAIKSGIQEIIKFDQALKNLQAISGATNAEISAMRTVIEDIARKTKFSTTEIAEGMVLLTQSGLSAEEAMNTMQATADLATGTLSDMKLVTDLMTTTLRAFNLESIESGRVADVMANAINKSKLTIEKLRIAFNFVGAAAAQTGISLEETAAAMGVLANNGLRASTIGTGLRQVLARLLSPNAKLRDAFAAHGVEIPKVSKALREDFGEALKYLAPLLVNQETRTVNMGKAYELFGLRGAQAAAVLIKAYISGDYNKMLERMYDVGSAEEMAAIQAEGLDIKLKNLQDRAKLVALAFGEGGVKGALGAVIDSLRGLMTIMETFVGSLMGQFILQTTLWTASIYGVARAVIFLGGAFAGGFIFKIKNAHAAFLLLSIIMGKTATTAAFLGTVLRTNIFFAVAAAIGGLITAFHLLNTAHERHIKELEKSAVESQAAADSLEVYDEALKNIRDRMEKLKKEGKDTTKINKEYEATIKRLLKDHPELKGSIDQLTASYENYAKAIGDTREEKKALSLQNRIDVLSDIKKEFDRIKKEEKAFYSQPAGAFGIFSGAKILRDIEENKKNAKKLTESTEDILHGLAYDIISQANDLARTLKEKGVSDLEIEIAVKSFKTMKRREVMSKYGSQLEEILGEDVEKKLKDAVDATGKSMGLSIENLTMGLEPKFEKFIKTLDVKDRPEFLSGLKSLQSRIEAYQKNMEDAGKGDAAEIPFVVRIMEDEFLKDFKEKVSKASREAAKEAQELDIEALEISGQNIKALELKIVNLKKENEILANSNKIRKNNNEILKAESEIAKLIQKRGSDLVDQTVKKLEVEGEVILARQVEIAQLEGEIASLKERNIGDQEAVEIAKLRTEIMSKEKDINDELIKQAEDRRKEEKKAFKDKLEQFKKYSTEYNAVIEEMFAAGPEILSYQDHEKYLDDLAKHNVDTAKWQYDQQLISAREYFDQIRILQERGLISPEEFAEKKIKLTGSAIEQIMFGIRKARQAVEDFRVALGEAIADKFATGLTDSILAFADGTKSAKEAYADFARSTIRWLAEIIIKQQILNALTGAGKSSGKSGGGFFSAIGTAIASLFHGGGVVGKDRVPRQRFAFATAGIPELHTGFGAKEFLAKLKVNETVFTEGQMDALGRAVRGSRQSQPVIQPYIHNDFSGSYFQDRETLLRTQQLMAERTVMALAPLAWKRDYEDDGITRRTIRRG